MGQTLLESLIYMAIRLLHRDSQPMALNPIVFTERVVRSFLRYQLTAYPFADERLHAQMPSAAVPRRNPAIAVDARAVRQFVASVSRGRVDRRVDRSRVFHPHMRQRIPQTSRTSTATRKTRSVRFIPERRLLSRPAPVQARQSVSLPGDQQVSRTSRCRHARRYQRGDRLSDERAGRRPARAIARTPGREQASRSVCTLARRTDREAEVAGLRLRLAHPARTIWRRSKQAEAR